jgi:hypothetical protein
VLEGKLSTTDGTTIPRRVDVQWVQRFTADGPAAWTTSSVNVGVEPDGRFEVAGPVEIGLEGMSGSDVPSIAEIEVSAGGFHTSRRWQSFTHPGRIELGEWLLEPRQPDIVILHVEDGRLRIFEGGQLLMMGGEDLVSARIARVWKQSDDSYGVCFEPSMSDLDRGIDVWRARLRAVPRMAATIDWSGLAAYSRVSDGVFRAEPLVRHEIELGLSPDGGPVRVCIDWHGIEGGWSRLQPVSGRRHVIKSLAPRDGLALRWRCVREEEITNEFLLSAPVQRVDLPACPKEVPR